MANNSEGFVRRRLFSWRRFFVGRRVSRLVACAELRVGGGEGAEAGGKGGLGHAALGDDRGDKPRGSDVKGRMRSADIGRNTNPGQMRDFLRRSAPRWGFVRPRRARDRESRSARQHRTELGVLVARTAIPYVPILLAVSPLRAMRSAPTTTAPIPPVFKKWPTMLSVIRVSGIPS